MCSFQLVRQEPVNGKIIKLIKYFPSEYLRTYSGMASNCYNVNEKPVSIKKNRRYIGSTFFNVLIIIGFRFVVKEFCRLSNGK